MQWLAQVHYKEALQGVRLVDYGGGGCYVYIYAKQQWHCQ